MDRALYVHVPFCRTRCAYCGFYSGEDLDLLAGYPAWVAAEARLRRDEAPAGPVLTSIYLGGGTPSLLGPEGVSRVLSAAREVWATDPGAEITVETNPACGADLTGLRRVDVNRLSVGVQALDDQVLARLGRPHRAEDARETLRQARRAGFSSLSADLLYGLPELSPGALGEWVRQLGDLGVSHISAYSLELVEGTPLARAVAAGHARVCGAEEEADQWEALYGALADAGFAAYEVSNFARSGGRCRHNRAYWEGSPYLALGPGAHGYSPEIGSWGTRWWNAPGLAAYRGSVESGELPPGGEERLTREEALLEFLFLGLRRTDPLDSGAVAARFGLDPGRCAGVLARLECQRLLAGAGGSSWRPTAAALRRADGLALWVRDLLLAPVPPLP